ncbi:hypothetical protein BHE74_00018638, partial [Ensete ventricosum]
LSHGKLYEHGLTKKRDDHKFCATSVSIDFSRTVFKLKNLSHSQHIRTWEVVLAQFVKKRDGHKLCAMSSFDPFFVHHLIISKYWPFTIC